MQKKLAKASVCISLSFILSFFNIFQLPSGGGVSLESLPLMILAWSEGPMAGLAGGIACGMLLLMKPSCIVHPIQFLLDYPIALSSFAIVGFLGKNSGHIKKWAMSASAFTARALCHTLSGVLFCSLFLKTPPENILMYSAAYNLSYMVPTAIICSMLFIWISSGIEKRNSHQSERESK